MQTLKNFIKGIRSHQKGFTIIEMVVVVAIIAILTSIILTNLSAPKAKARDAKAISDLGQLQFALELYYDRCHEYPGSLSTGESCTTPGGGSASFGDYMSVIPHPVSGSKQEDDYDYIPKDTRDDYVLHTALEMNVEAAKDSISVPNWLGSGAVDCSNTSADNINYCLGPK